MAGPFANTKGEDYQPPTVDLSELTYSTNGVRKLPIKQELAEALREAVTAVYGSNYRVDVMSAAQPPGPKGTPGTTGTRRHGTGAAADIWVYAPDGHRLSGDELVPLSQHWLATDTGSVGFPANAHNSLHLDLIGGKGPGAVPLGKGEGRVWYYGTPSKAQRTALSDSANNGTLPAYATSPGSVAAAYAPVAPVPAVRAIEQATAPLVAEKNVVAPPEPVTSAPVPATMPVGLRQTPVTTVPAPTAAPAKPVEYWTAPSGQKYAIGTQFPGKPGEMSYTITKDGPQGSRVPTGEPTIMSGVIGQIALPAIAEKAGEVGADFQKKIGEAGADLSKTGAAALQKGQEAIGAVGDVLSNLFGGFGGGDAEVLTELADKDPVFGGLVKTLGDRIETQKTGTPGTGYDTPLSWKQEAQFQIWKAAAAPDDSGQDYDLRGAWKSGAVADAETGHWPDTYKKPVHPTFSDESVYAKYAPQLAGHWDGDTYVPRAASLEARDERAALKPPATPPMNAVRPAGPSAGLPAAPAAPRQPVTTAPVLAPPGMRVQPSGPVPQRPHPMNAVVANRPTNPASLVPMLADSVSVSAPVMARPITSYGTVPGVEAPAFGPPMPKSLMANSEIKVPQAQSWMPPLTRPQTAAQTAKTSNKPKVTTAAPVVPAARPGTTAPVVRAPVPATQSKAVQDKRAQTTPGLTAQGQFILDALGIGNFGTFGGLVSTGKLPPPGGYTYAPSGNGYQNQQTSVRYSSAPVYGSGGQSYGSDPGQVTAGLKPGDRVYNPDTNSWARKT